MKLKETRFLRGPNVYADTPCLLALIEPGHAGDAGSGLRARVLALLPALPAAATPGNDCIAFAVAPLVMELQRRAGAPGAFSCTIEQADGVVRVACGYALEQVAAEALAHAFDMIGAVVRGEHFALDDAVARLSHTAARHAIGTSTGAVLAAAQRRGIPYQRLTAEANLFQLGWGRRQQRLQATITGATNSVAVRIASDKQLTKALLEQAGVPVPRGATVTSLEDALREAQGLGGLVTVKPLDANQGKGVTTMCGTPDDVARAFGHAREHGRHIIVERHLEGHDYRVLVAGHKVVAASCRRPPCVTGDGRRTVRALVEAENLNPARGEGHTNILTRIPLDDPAAQALARQGYSFESVPPDGAEVELRGNANLSTGGTAEDVTDLLHEDTRELCVRAARAIGLDVAGIDIVCRDIAQPLREQDGGVIEVNAAPGIRMHQYPSRGAARDAGAAIVDALFGQDDGRIPVVAVSGGSGATTAALLVGHAARVAGTATGVATASGVWFGGELAIRGGCGGYRSARSVLSAPDVDFAVLETAPDAILREGVAFDRCDVSVVLHMPAHGGESEAVEVLARRARLAVVLNAEDERCVAMAGALSDSVEIIYFALDAEHQVLVRHLERGGRGAYMQDATIVLADGVRHHALLRGRDAPYPRGAIAPALAAACAMAASGFGTAEIEDGLRGFALDGVHERCAGGIASVAAAAK